MFKPGDVILARIQFADASGAKVRPAVVLFEELGNVVVAGVTSNLKMKGVPLSKKEGAAADSVIKLNYLFTLSESMVSKSLFHLTPEKKRMVFEGMSILLSGLKK
ncbi:type II toxin-antitoxin system PemK/MazF family toxin [Candidatus Micrarchaeota archaeon]|nr:type II toxin-antitoxin system PemK/MazF family toxin [Candidatus Micrarchaeota archaeon]